MKAVAIFMLLLLAAATLSAGTYTGILNAPASGQTATITWAGGPLNGTYGLSGTATQCTTLTCDTYILTVNVPSTFYSSNPSYAVHVAVDWASNVNDIDLYIMDSSGNVVCSSTAGFTTSEDADCGALPSGQYTVQVGSFIGVNKTYNGKVTLAPEAPMAIGRAKYKPGNFTFATPLVLSRPAQTASSTPLGTTFLEQDAEPRVGHDSVGNIYAAAIQGIPAGSDMWKSMDGGKSFTYAGQPDGTQAAAALGIGTGVGIGGGDEDFVIGPNGGIALSSLWLGAVTNCASSDGAASWLCNPLASDVPEDDRQWLAWSGANTVYLTTKNLGTLTAGTESIYVVRSDDGGKTFTQFTQVTKPTIGVQPGDQGNIVVDSRNGYVYNVFMGSDPSQIYLAKSTDKGASFVLKLVFQGPAGSNMQHVFPAIAVDRGGGLHVVFNDGTNSYLTSSKDQGATWTTPIRLNNSADSKTSLEPWIVAGDFGKVNVFFYGTKDSSFLSPTADWKIFMAQTLNAFDRLPVVTQSAATYVMHHGPICVDGTGCASGTRNLLEYFYPDVYIDGTAMAVYPDDLHVDPAKEVTRAWFVKQTGGSKVQ